MEKNKYIYFTGQPQRIQKDRTEDTHTQRDLRVNNLCITRVCRILARLFRVFIFLCKRIVFFFFFIQVSELKRYSVTVDGRMIRARSIRFI